MRLKHFMQRLDIVAGMMDASPDGHEIRLTKDGECYCPVTAVAYLDDPDINAVAGELEYEKVAPMCGIDRWMADLIACCSDEDMAAEAAQTGWIESWHHDISNLKTLRRFLIDACEGEPCAA